MGYNFRPVERDQQFLMPPSVADWLPDDDLAWVVLDAVDQVDLDAIRGRYRPDGHGAPAYDPALLTALLLYAYATGERSSRKIEALTRRDIAYRVICANATPDHTTIARFRATHEEALAAVFLDVLGLCRTAGLGRLGIIALDGTRIAADVSPAANRSAVALDAEIAAILAEAAAADATEDAAYGPERRGDELPAGLADRRSRLARLAEARRQLADEEAARAATYEADLAARAERAERTGRRPPGAAPCPDSQRRRSWGKRNTTDPDSRPMPSHGSWLVGYNGQISVAEDGLILAAELTTDSGDNGQLAPMVERTRDNLRAAGFRGRTGPVVADAGYWSEANVAAVEAAGRTRLLIPPDRGRPRTPNSRLPVLPAREKMRRRFARPADRARYRRRKAIVEPVFGQLKANRGVRRFARRGYRACASEWRLLCLTHNLLKLWRSGWRGPRRGYRATGRGSQGR